VAAAGARFYACRVEFRLLGPLELVGDDGQLAELPAGKPRALLGRLLLEESRVVSVDRIVDVLWAGRPPPTAAKVVQGYVSRLRKLLPAGALGRQGSGYLLAVEPARVDLGRFDRLLSVASGRCPYVRLKAIIERDSGCFRFPAGDSLVVDSARCIWSAPCALL